MTNTTQTDRTEEIIARQKALLNKASEIMTNHRGVTLRTAIASIACGKPSDVQVTATDWLRAQ